MRYKMLSIKEGFGQVVVCDQCSDIHVTINNVTLNMKPWQFKEIVDMVHQAALNQAATTGRATDDFSRLFNLS